MATSADGKSQGNLCSSLIALNASKQIRPQLAASGGLPGRSTILIFVPRREFGRSHSKQTFRGIPSAAALVCAPGQMAGANPAVRPIVSAQAIAEFVPIYDDRSYP